MSLVLSTKVQPWPLIKTILAITVTVWRYNPILYVNILYCSLVGVQKPLDAYGPTGGAAKPAAADDDDFDLFGSDEDEDEEELERIKQVLYCLYYEA